MWEVMVAERLKDGLADALARSPAAAYSQAIMTAIVCRASAIIAAAQAIIAAHSSNKDRSCMICYATVWRVLMIFSNRVFIKDPKDPNR